jgi:hypothetical protein
MSKTSTLVRVVACVSLIAGATGATAQTYDPMRPAANPLSPLMKAPAPTTAAPTAAPNPDLDNLPDGPGAEETYYQCIACHSTAIIRQQHLTDARWDYLWTWMIKEQGMYEPDDEIKEEILTYLKTHFSSER